MFEQIEKEIKQHCSKCEKVCEQDGCVLFRIKKLISVDVEITNIDIDKFFEADNQSSLFD